MLEATRWTTACTCSGDSVVPGWVETRTEAVVGSWASVKTSFCGIATWTTAVVTPSMPSMVRESSPSMARLKSVCSLNSEVERSWSSSSE